MPRCFVLRSSGPFTILRLILSQEERRIVKCLEFGPLRGPPDAHGFQIEAPRETHGRCRYLLNDTPMDITWQRSLPHNIEWYGVENVLGVRPWITINGPGVVTVTLRL